ncbi:MAG: class I SAM-dependent methyltransferase, partial [Planctomycetota bacterium]
SPDACPACGDRELIEQTVHASDVPTGLMIGVRACPRCEFAWQWPPQRDLEQSVEHALRRYTENQSNDYYDPDRRRQVAKIQLGYIESLTSEVGSVLDVGCGDGAFIRNAAKRGWKAVGHDPGSPISMEGNPRLAQATLSDLDGDERFDVVTLWDVIEHLDEPESVLEAARARLKPGGWLVVETGNYQSLTRLQAGASWWAFAADHRWYFAPPILMQMLSELGLRDVRCPDRVLRPGWSGEVNPKPWLRGTLQRILRNPVHTGREIRRHRQTHEANRRWPRWSGIPIFVVAGRHP